MKTSVNLEVYDLLGERWYHGQDDPIALLRAEAQSRNPWIQQVISERFRNVPVAVLDIGCGGGFLSNSLAKHGHLVTGLDRSQGSLDIARRFDETKRVVYVEGDAYALPFDACRFDVCCALDFLEHVEEPSRVIEEAARVLKPGGLFFFHTFHRNPLSWLFAVKGIEWVVRNTPKNLHLYRLFIKPHELQAMCEKSGLNLKQLLGSQPNIFSKAFLKLLATGIVPPEFSFSLTRKPLIGYLGYAERCVDH